MSSSTFPPRLGDTSPGHLGTEVVDHLPCGYLFALGCTLSSYCAMYSTWESKCKWRTRLSSHESRVLLQLFVSCTRFSLFLVYVCLHDRNVGTPPARACCLTCGKSWPTPSPTTVRTVPLRRLKIRLICCSLSCFRWWCFLEIPFHVVLSSCPSRVKSWSGGTLDLFSLPPRSLAVSLRCLSASSAGKSPLSVLSHSGLAIPTHLDVCYVLFDLIMPCGVSRSQ